jgi:anti-sigma B factor antagonist
MPGLRTRIEAHGAATVLALSGELDLSTQPAALAGLNQAERAADGLLVVDLRGLTFMDATGVKLLVAGAEHAAGVGRPFAVVQGDGIIPKVLAITKADQRFRVVSSVEELV